MMDNGVSDLQFRVSNSVEMLGAMNNFCITALSNEAGEMFVRLEKPMRAEASLI
jgi:hypothetical protein